MLCILMLALLAGHLGAQDRRPANKRPVSQTPPDAPTGFDNRATVWWMIQPTRPIKDIDGVEDVAGGLGPLYNAQSCAECHQNPVSGGASQVTELRVGHQGPDGHFRTPDIPIAHGAGVVTGRSLVNDRAICPNAVFPDKEIQERVPETETIRTFRPESFGRWLH
jgi:hypothetical protein